MTRLTTAATVADPMRIDAVATGKWGMMVALQGADIVTVPLAEATKELKVVDPALYAEAEVFFG